VRLMLEDKTMAQDREMLQEMEQLRLHAGQVADGLQAMLTTMERIQDRIRVR
jgi:hypothetical protein